MKTTSFLLAGLIFSFLFFTGCEDALDITESFDFEVEFVLQSNETTSTETENVDMASSVSLINQYGDKIKDIEIEQVTYWLVYHNGSENQKIVQASITVSDENGMNPVELVSIQNQLLKPLVGNPAELSVNQAAVEQLENYIGNSPYKFRLVFTSTCNEAPIDFKVKMKFKAKMTANPLN